MKKQRIVRKHRVSSMWWIGGLILLAGLSFIVGVGQMNTANAATTPGQSMARSLVHPVPASFPQYPPGIPAIHPHLAVAHPSAGNSTFTAADADQYVTMHPFWNTNIQVVGSFTVAQTTFLMSSALSIQLHNESIGRPDTSLVCYVELHGTFIFAGEKGPMTVHIAYEVFDAQTGNLILTGGKIR